MQKIKCGVVGVGYLGNFHAQKYSNLPNADLVAICDTNEARAKEIANSHNTSFFTDYNDLIGKVDAVSIVTITTSHYAIAKKFLENKIHVFVEKPITTTIAEADELIKIAKANHLIFQVGHIERFNPVFNVIKNKIRKPTLVECIRVAPYKARCNDVSVVLDLMIHDIDLVYSLIQSPIRNIVAHGGKILSPTTDVIHAQIEFENGANALLTASRLDPVTQRRINVLEKDCYYTGDLGEKTLKIIKNNGNHEELTLEKNDALYEEIASFLDAIENKKNPIVSGNDGRIALETALLIEQKTKIL